MIEVICSYPWNLVCGLSATIGGIGVGLFTYFDKKKKDKKVKFNFHMFVDTVWQSALVGYGASFSIGCGYFGILLAGAGAVGIDKIANKFKIGDDAVLNIIQYIAKLLNAKDKKK